MATTSSPTPQAAAKKVFVISPIGANGSPVRKHADRFLDHIVKKALPAPGYIVERADGNDSAWAITEAMLRGILEADLCVADITGHNPNVMYELGLAHAADKKVVIMKFEEDAVPFDIKDQRVITYGLYPEQVVSAIADLKAKAEHEPDAFKDLLNPVAAAFQSWTARQQLESARDPESRAVVHALESLERKVNALPQGPNSDGSMFGTPSIYQTTQPGADILVRWERLHHAFGRIMNELDPNDAGMMQLWRDHLHIGENLHHDLIMGRGVLTELSGWCENTQIMLEQAVGTSRVRELLREVL